MRGNPIARLVVLALALAGAGMLVGVITRPVARAQGSPQDTKELPVTQPAGEADLVVDAFVEIQLSAPARSIALGSPASPVRAFEVTPSALIVEAEFSLALKNGIPIKDLLVVDWENPAQSNFLHLTIEPERLKTRELTLHFPPGEETAILELAWPEKHPPSP